MRCADGGFGGGGGGREGGRRIEDLAVKGAVSFALADGDPWGGGNCHPTHNIHIHLRIITYVPPTIINAYTFNSPHKCAQRGERTHSHGEAFGAPTEALAEGVEAAENVDG